MSHSPLMVAVFDDVTYGVVMESSASKLKFLTCSSKILSCGHVEFYKDWARDNNTDLGHLETGSVAIDNQSFPCISPEPIPFTAGM